MSLMTILGIMLFHRVVIYNYSMWLPKNKTNNNTISKFFHKISKLFVFILPFYVCAHQVHFPLTYEEDKRWMGEIWKVRVRASSCLLKWLPANFLAVVCLLFHYSIIDWSLRGPRNAFLRTINFDGIMEAGKILDRICG